MRDETKTTVFENATVAKPEDERRWSREEGARAVAAWKSSKLSMTAFAKEKRLSLARLRWWNSELSKGTRPKLRLLPVERQRVLPGIEIVLSSGLVVKIPESSDARAVLHLVKALGEDEC